MRKVYERLSLEEREEISRLLAQGESFYRIGKVLGRARSTILREVSAGSGNRHIYRASRGQKRASRNASSRKHGKRKLKKEKMLREIVFQKLKLRWSPEQIAQWLKKTYPDDVVMHISHEAIYSYVYVLPKGELKRDLLKHLRRSHKYRHKRSGNNGQKRHKIPNLVSIDERPVEVNDRVIPGHWEGDLIVGKRNKSALGTLVERKTRYVMLVRLNSRETQHVAQRYAAKFNKLPSQMRLSMTYDQGTEMTSHEALTQTSKIKVYFAHPRSPWERGTNENTNGLIRQFFPKGTDFTKISAREIKKVECLINERPRKTLGWETPQEIFTKTASVALNN